MLRSVVLSSKFLHRILKSNQSVKTVKCRLKGSRCGVSGKTWMKPSGYDTGLQTFNSLTKQKEPLILARDGVATWYSCGPTVYDHAHLGHACSYVRFDILQRILTRMFGITVIHAMVITDIDDKIIRRSWEENVSPAIIARMYEEEFKKDMLSLKVIPPAVYLRVTDNVNQIVAFIEGIIKNGHAYATKEGDVYFDVQSIGDSYGKFVGAVGSHGEPGSSNKRDSRDFALWKRSKPQEPSWDSPWGKGRPGWHIECSTVASSVFGSQLDIHSGGIDLAFPHHENEVAQSEAYHRCTQWGNYFLHSGHLHLKGSTEKMSKSLKNYITIKDFLKSYSASEFRMFCLLTKYRSAVDYSDGSMAEARASLESVRTFLHAARAYAAGLLQCSPVQEDFLWERLADAKSKVTKALADDFDTPRAIGALMNLVYHGNCQLQPVSMPEAADRSPAVFGAMVTYIRDVLEAFGVDLLNTRVRKRDVSVRTSPEQIFKASLCAGGRPEQIWKSARRRGTAGSLQERGPSVRARSSGRSDLQTPEQTRTLPRPGSSAQSVRRPEGGPGSSGRADKGSRIRLHMGDKTESEGPGERPGHIKPNRN